jgi:hypothetical protein
MFSSWLTLLAWLRRGESQIGWLIKTKLMQIPKST